MESQIPEHIKAANKALVFSKSESDCYMASRDFYYFVIDNNIKQFGPYNVELADFTTEVFDSLSNALRPNYKDGMITGFTSILDIYRNRPQTMKAGKYLKKIFPWMTDARIESCVSELKAEFLPVEFELHTGKDEESFRFAYQEQHTPKRSPSFSSFGFDCYVKRLDSSCMRGYYFPKPTQHPAIVYAAGDIEIVYAKQVGKDTIGARVLTYPDKKRFSDIYTADDTATELLVNYLREKGFTSKGIDGAKIRKIDHPGGYLMPYLDDCEFCEDIGDYFILGDGNIRCRSTEGFIYVEPQNYCEFCEGYTSEELTQVDSGNCVCQCCLSNDYIYSELMDSYIRQDEAYTTGNGDIATERYLDRNGYILDVDCEYQLESECVYYNGDYYHQSHCDVTYFEGEYYHEDSDEFKEAIEAKEKADIAYQVKTTTTLQWIKMEERSPTPYLAFVTTKERTLRDNYQINAQGEPERLPDFLELLDITPELACI
jgi:hypothetical protein